MKLKSLLLSLISLGLYLFANQSLAQVTASSHAAVTVEACTSFSSTQTSIPYTFTISENNTDDIGQGTFYLELPANFTFSGTVTASKTGSDLTLVDAAIDAAPNNRQIIITLSGTATATIDSISISGLAVVAASANLSGSLTYKEGTATINGLSDGYKFMPISSAAAPMNVSGGTLSATATYCLNETAAILTVSGGTTSSTTSNTLTYQWQSSVNNINFTDISTATGAEYQPLTNAIGTTYYRRKITESANGLSCEDYSSSVSILVKTLDAGEISGNEELCYDAIPNAIGSVRDASVAGEVVTYDWEQSLDGVSWTNAPSTNGPTLSFGTNTLTQTTQYRRIAFSTSCTVTKSSNVVTKTVFGPLDGGTITPSTQLVYIGNTPASLTVSSTSNSGNVSGTLTYQWQSSTDNINFTNISGATGNTYQPSGSVTGTLYFKAISTLTNGDVICEQESSVADVTVYVLNPGSISGDQSVCADHIASDLTAIGSVNASLSPPNAGNPISYTWESSTDNSTWSTVVGAQPTFSFSNAITQSTYYRRVASIQSGVITRTSNTILKTLLSSVTGGSMATVSATLCFGTPIPELVVNGDSSSGTLSYQWQYSSDGNTFANISGQTGQRLSPTETAVGTHYYRRNITQTTNGVACTATSSVTTIYIKSVSPGEISGDQSICSGETPAQFLSTTDANANGDAITYLWQSANSISGPWSAASGTNSNTTYQETTPLTQTTYYRRQASTLACTSSVTTNIIEVTVAPAVTGGTMAAGSVSQTICLGDTPTMLSVNAAAPSGGVVSYQWQRSVGDNTNFTNLPGITSATFSPTVPTAAGEIYFRRITNVQNGDAICTATSSESLLLVVGLTPGTIGGEQTVCHDTSAITITNVAAADASGEIPSYSWEQSIDSGANWAIIPGASDPNYVTGQVTQTTQFRRWASSPTCTTSKTTNVVTISVIPELVAGTASGTQTVCVGETPLDLTVSGATNSGGTLSYQWQSSSSVATNTFSNITDNSNAFNERFAPLTNSTGTTYYRRLTIVSSGGQSCEIPSSIVSVTVVDIVGGSVVTPTQTLCSGGAVADIQITGTTPVPGEVYQWQQSTSNTNSSSFSLIAGEAAASFTPSNTQTGTTYYRRITSVPGSSCVAYSDAASVIVTDLSPGVISGDETLCYNANGTLISQSTPAVASGSSGLTITYEWQQRIGTSGTTWTLATGTNDGATYNPGQLTQTTSYRRIVSTNSCTATQTSNIIVKTVLAELEGGTPSSATATQTLCVGGTVTPLVVENSSGSINFQWQSSSQTGTGFTDISGATNATYTPAANAGTTYYRRIIKNGSNCEAISGEFEVSVVSVTPGSIDGAKTVCYGGDGGTLGSVADATAGSLTINYVWQEKIGSGPWTNSTRTGNSSTTLSVGTITQTTSFRRQANATSCTATVTTNAVEVTVTPELNGGTAAGSQTLCTGTTTGIIDLTVSGASPSSGVSYQWQSAANDNPVDYTDISGATFASYTPSTSVSGTLYYRRLIRSTAASACVTPSSVVSVTVVDVVGGSVVTPTQTLCYNSTPQEIQIIGSGSGLSGLSYQWQQSTSSATDSSTFTIVPNEASATLIPSNTQTGTTYYRRITSVPGSSCVAYSDAAAVTVQQLFPGTIEAAETLCYNATASTISSPSDPARTSGGPSMTITYRWEQRIGTSGTTWTLATGTNDGATYNPGQLTQTTSYRRIVSTNSCTATQTSNIIVKTVLAELEGGTPSSATATQTLCVGGTVTPLVVENSSGSTNYQWQSSSQTGTGFTDISGATNATYTPAATAGTTYYRRIIKNGSNCEAISGEFEVSVVSVTPGSIDGAKTVCYGGDGGTIGSVADATAGGAEIAYTWEQSINAGGAWTTIATNVSSTTYNVGALTTTTLFRRSASVSGTITCSQTATTTSVEVKVLSELQGGTAVGNQTVCVGATPLSDLTVSGASGAGVNFQWQSSATNIPSDFTNITTGVSTATNYIPDTSTQGTLYYRRLTMHNTIPSNTQTCTAISSVVSVTVVDVDGGTMDTPTQTLCYGQPVTELTITLGSATGGANLTYQWQSSTTAPGTDSSTYSLISGNGQNYTPSNTQTGTTYYRRITRITGSSCVSYSQPAQVTVVQLLPGEISGDQELCYGADPTVITQTTPAVTSGNSEPISYNWQQQIGLTTTPWVNAIGTRDGATYDPGTLTQTTRYRRIASIGTCSSNTVTSNIVVITILDEIDGGTFSSAEQIVCQNEPASPLTINSSTNTATLSGTLEYQWQQSSDNIPANFTNITATNANRETYTPSSTLTGTTFYRRATSLTQGGRTCTEYSDIQRFTVIGLDPGAIDGDQELCYEEPLVNISPIGNLRSALITPNTAGETLTYVFEQSINNGATWSQIQSGVNPSYDFSNTLTQTTWFRRLVSSPNCSNTVTSTIVIKNVTSELIGGTISGNQTICVGEDPVALSITTATNSSTVSGTLTYQWQSSRINNAANFTNLTDTSAAGETYLPDNSATATGTIYYRRVMSIDGSSCEAISDVAAVTVVGIDAGTISATSYACYEEEVIIGNTRTASTVGGTAESITYTWQRQIGTGSWEDLQSGTTNTTYTIPSNQITQTANYRRLALSTACSTNDNPSNTITIEVLPTITAGTVSLTNSGPTTVCENEAPGELRVVNGTNTSTFNLRYQWLSRISPTGTYTNIAGAVGNVYNPGTLTQTTYFIRQAYFEERPSCTVNSAELQITVPQINAGTITGTRVICQDETNILISSTAGATITDGARVNYTWQRTSLLTGTDAEWETVVIGTQTQTGESLTIPSAPSSNTIHYRRMAEIDGQSCPAYSNVVTLKINRFTNASNIRFSDFGQANIQLCGNLRIPSLGFSGTQFATGVLSYTWEISQDNNTNWQTMTPTTQNISAAEIDAQIQAMGGNYQKDYYFRRTTYSTLDGVTCTQVSNEAGALYGSTNLSVAPGSITINMSATNNNLTEQVICEGQSPGTFVGTTATASITNISPTTNLQVFYSWYSSNSENGVYRSIPGATNKDYTSGVLTQTTYFKRVVSVEDPYDECRYFSENTLTIIVPRGRNITSSNNQTIVCAGQDLGSLVTFGSTIPTIERDAMSFQWFKKTASESSFTEISGETAETYSNPAAITETTTFRRRTTITVTGTNSPTCSSGPFNADYTITVNHAEPGSIRYNGTLRPGTTSEIDICFGTEHAGFNTDGSNKWDVYGNEVFEWFTSPTGNDNDYTSTGILTETYPPSTITQTIWIKRRISSVYTYTLNSDVVTSTCSGVSSSTSFSNIFKINVLPNVEIPRLTTTMNAQICATDLSPGSITISNMYSPTSDGVEYIWETSVDKTVWTTIKDPANLSQNFTGQTYQVPQLTQDTHYRVIASVLSDTLCTYTSEPITIEVINIDPGVIAFSTPTAQDGYFQTCGEATPVLTITNKPSQNHDIYPRSSVFTITWQSKPKDGVSSFRDLTFNSQISSPSSATLLASSMTESIYIRKRVAVLNDAGDVVCEEFTNSVLIDYVPTPTVNIPDPQIFVTDPSCFEGSDGSITISPTAIVGGTTADRKQSVQIELSGTYSTTATFRTTVGGVNYDYTATGSNTSINSLTASISAYLQSSALSSTLDISHLDNLITLTSKTAGTPFTISTNILNNTESSFNLEYLDTNAKANSYSWRKLLGDSGQLTDTSFADPETLNLSGLAAGRYELTVTNNLDCTAVTVSPTFNLINPNPIVAGTLTSSLGDLVCEGATPLLSVPNLTLPPNPIYIWQQSLDGDNANPVWTTIKTAGVTVTTATYSVTGTITQTTWFRRGINSNLAAGVNCAPDYSYTPALKIDVNLATPGSIQYNGNSDNGRIEICYNEQPASFLDGSTAYTVSGAVSFEWYKKEVGGNWSLIPGATEVNYQPQPLTKTTQFRRKVLSNITVGTVTLTCDDSDEEDNFSNSFTVVVKEEMPKPAIVSSVNTVCASDLSRGTLSLTNATDIALLSENTEQVWESSTDSTTWSAIADGNGGFEDSNTYRLPALFQETYYRLKLSYVATGTNSPSCTIYSDPITIKVVNIEPGTIVFKENPVVENVLNTCVSLDSPIVIGAASAATEAKVPGYESSFESFWESKNTTGGNWGLITLSGNYSGSVNNQVLNISNRMDNSMYVRRVIRQEISPGIFCTEYSNVLLINVLDAPTLNIPTPRDLVTDPTCPGGTDGAIEVPAAAVLGGSQTAQAQRVNITLSGTYTRSGTYTPSGRYEVTINSNTYSYTATASNTTLASLTASLTAALTPGPSIQVVHVGSVITLTASDTGVPFTISTNISSRTTDTRMSVEYVRPALNTNSFSWVKLEGATGDQVDNTVTLSNTLRIENLDAGRYEFTATNNTTCASVSQRFEVLDKVLVPGTISASTNEVLCVDHSGFTLTVTGDSSFSNQEYLWEQSSDNLTWSQVMSGTSSVTTASLSIGTQSNTTFYRRGVRLDNGGTPCTTAYAYTAPIEMIVNKVSPGSVNTEELIVCAGSNPSIPISQTAAANNQSRGAMTYFWEALPSGASVWTTVSGATAENLTFSTPLNETTAFRRITTNTINGIACNSIPSNVVTITTVTPTTFDNAAILTRVENVSCNGVADGAIRVELTDFVSSHPSPTFEWQKRGDGGFRQNTMQATGLTPGEYKLSISTYTNTIQGVVVPVCIQSSDWFTITEPAALSLTLSATCDGLLTATGTGGLENYIYTLTSTNTPPVTIAAIDGSAHTFPNLIKGATYTVTLSENGLRTCSPISQQIVMPIELDIDESKLSSTDATCFGVNDGTITVADDFVVGGSGRYTFEWKGPAGVTYFTRDLNNLGPGQYELTVTDALGCSDTAIIEVGSVSELSIVRSQLTNAVLSCNGDTDAAIEVQFSADPNADLQIVWTNNNGTAVTASVTNNNNTTSISGLGAGVYRLTISDLNSPDSACKIEETYTISEPEAFNATPIGETESPACFSSNGGTANFRVTGGTPPYKYSIDNGAQVSFGTSSVTAITKSITGIQEGTHTISFTDANNCAVVVIPNIVVTIPEEIEISEPTITEIPCGGFGSIAVTVSGGSGSYNYQWTGPGINRVTTQPSLNVTEGGSYTLLVTDANRCTKTINISIDPPAAPFEVIGTVDQSSCSVNAADASISLSISTGVSPNVVWEKWELKSAAGGTVSTTTSTCTVDCYEWANLNRPGDLLLTGLTPGEYRATITDSSGEAGACNTVVKNFTIGAAPLDIFNTKVTPPTCEVETGSFAFRLKHTNALKFFLNGNEVSIANGQLKYNNTTQQYRIPELTGGSYLLRIVEQIPLTGTQTGTTNGCEIFENFTLGAFEPISYLGETDLVLDVCDPSNQAFPNTALVGGGTPFVNAAQEPYYIYRWTGLATGVPLTGTGSTTTGTATPTTGTASATTASATTDSALGFVSFISTEAVPLNPGKYSLVIEDAEGCLSDPIEFLIEANIKPISVTVNTQELSCGIDPSDGAFSIAIEGGAAPYNIIWEREIPGNAQDPNPSYELVGTNLLAINNLAAGRYRLKIGSSLVNCANSQATNFTGFYTLSPAETIQILDGPFLSRSLCIGEPGTLNIKVFDRDSDDFSFYYQGSLVSSNFIGDDTYEVTIDQPVEDGILNVINEQGCGVSVAITTGVGEPEFSYSSTNYDQSGIIAANEEVTFTNSSLDLYTKMTWDFGDGSDILEVTAENAATTDIVHKYRTPGTFTVAMRFYNALGCYKETTQELIVGRGYLVIFPSAFTPNADGINDVFEPKYTGIKSFKLDIYDMWGNLVFTTTVEELPVATGWGWDGNQITGIPYAAKNFRFSFTAITHDDKEYTTNGEAILLR